MHMRDLRRFSSLWLHKTEELRADVGHWSKQFTGDIYEAGWLSEMYGYSFAAAEVFSILINYELLPPFCTASDLIQHVELKYFHHSLHIC